MFSSFQYNLLASTVVLLFAYLAFPVTPDLEELIDLSKCPYCYGRTICDRINQAELDPRPFGRIIPATKNVYFGSLDGDHVAMKKLATDRELEAFDGTISEDSNYTEKVIENLNDRSLLKPFKLCNNETSAEFYYDILDLKSDDVDDDVYMKNVWTILNVNIEPLILRLLKTSDADGNDEGRWPFPKYYGACGRLIVEEQGGYYLSAYPEIDWHDRALIAYRLIRAVKNLTEKHHKYRFYLTDISSDNIVVDDDLNVMIIDIENLIVQLKGAGLNSTHASEDIRDDDGFSFSEDEICRHERSDHNYYAVCKLILSANAPFPMFRGGLLRNPPRKILENHYELFNLINKCEVSDNRIEIINEILSRLSRIITYNSFDNIGLFYS